jgi:hypothetical protein
MGVNLNKFSRTRSNKFISGKGPFVVTRAAVVYKMPNFLTDGQFFSWNQGHL